MDCATVTGMLLSLPRWNQALEKQEIPYNLLCKVEEGQFESFPNFPLQTRVSIRNAGTEIHCIDPNSIPPYLHYSLPPSSAGFTAITSVAMRLLDRYKPGQQCLALRLLFRAVCCTPSATVQSFVSWILPQILINLK